MDALQTAQSAHRPIRTASRLVRNLQILLAAGIAAFVIAELCGVADLRDYEFGAILDLVGWKGVSVIAGINIALLTLLMRLVFALRRRPQPLRVLGNIVLAVGAVLLFWALEYLYMESPVTARLTLLTRDNRPLQLNGAIERDFSSFSLVRGVSDPSSVEKLRVMYERIRINNPGVYATHPIGATIDKYAAEYRVDPAILFYLNYIDSWYGESASGPAPFLRAMTPETIRDFVQSHLPGWFIENPLRRWLTTSTILEKVFGANFGFKLRYAFHKATLDVSISPYALNTYSDIFLVLREYPEAFPDVFANPQRDPVEQALFESFQILRDSAMVAPYEENYSRPPLDAAYYSAHREDLKRFTRAAFYMTLRNFDFATRAQALLTKYENDYFSKRLGEQRWAALPAWQRGAMLTMIRDLYVGNVGHLGYDLYALPELNATPDEFVAAAALSEGGLPVNSTDKLWRPRHYEKLWAGAGYRLRVFEDMWETVYGSGFPGMHGEDTTDDARRIVRIVAGE